MRGTRRLFQLPVFSRRTARAEMCDELAFHLEQRVAFLVARGMDPHQARAEAERRLGASLTDAEQHLGDSAALKERRLDVRDRINDFIDDVRYAVRGLTRNPAFTIVAVLTLAIGIGANTAIYSAVDALLLRALPYPQPGRLMDVVQTFGKNGDTQWSYPRLTFYRNAQKSFSSVAAYVAEQTTVTGNEPQRIDAEEVTAAYLTTLKLNVAAGHDFDPESDIAGGAPRVALISDALWQRRFNADPKIAGKTIDLDNTPWTVAGVLPTGFRGLSGRADVLLNLSAREPGGLAAPWSLEFSVVGRLAPGAEPAQAEAEASQIGARIAEAFPVEKGTLTTSTASEKWSATARPLDTIRVASGLRTSLLVLFGAVTLVLLIACVNLANLLIARGLARRSEIAVRLAIGAGRGRLVRLFVTESIVLAALGGVASIGVALAGTRVLSTLNPREALVAQGFAGGIGAVGFDSIALDGRALAFAFAATLAVGLAFGLAPAIRATRADLAHDLRDGSASAGLGRRVGATRHVLVVAEVALALVLLAGSGLMIRSLGKLLQVDPGFDGRNVVTLRLSIPPGTVAPDSMPGFYDELQRAIAGVSGVESVALADCAPLSNGCNGTIMTFADRPPTATGNAMIGVHWVSPTWFPSMRVPLQRGRAFTTADRLGTPKVVMINEAAARKYFPGEDPLGKRVAVYQGGFHTGAEVIGIVGDVRYGTIDSTARPDVYISYGQSRVSRMIVFARTSGNPAALMANLRGVVRRVAPQIPVFDVRTMSARMASATAQARFSATLLALFAVVALSLAVMGIYGVMSFAVAQRTREIGIRVALGADRASVLSLVMHQGLVLAGAGIAIGLGAALAFTRVLRTMLFEVGTTDIPTYASMVVVLTGAVLVASWIPARRAARVDPMVALRRG